jgi:hypothetical protein
VSRRGGQGGFSFLLWPLVVYRFLVAMVDNTRYDRDGAKAEFDLQLQGYR